MELVEKISYDESPRVWTAALMDYGATLPKIIKHNSNKQSKHYTKQSKFTGSDRQIRGMILEILLEKKDGKILQSLLFKQIKVRLPEFISGSITKTKNVSDVEKLRYKNIITKLITEGFIVKEKKSIILK